MRRALTLLRHLSFTALQTNRSISTGDLTSALSSLRHDPSAALTVFRRHHRPESASYHLLFRILVSHRRFGPADSLVDSILSGACPDASAPLLNDVVRFFCARRHLFSALDAFFHMLRLGGSRAPTAETYAMILDAIVRRFDRTNTRHVYLRSVRCLVRTLTESRVAPNARVMDLVLRAYAKCGQVRDALEVFDEMSKCRFEVEEGAYGCLVEALVMKGRVDEGARLLGEMRKKGMVPTTRIFSSVMNGLSMKGRFEEAAEVMEDMLQVAKTPDLLTYRTLLEGLCRVRRKEEAFGMLERLKGRKGALSERTHRYLLDGLHWLCQDPNRI